MCPFICLFPLAQYYPALLPSIASIDKKEKKNVHSVDSQENAHLRLYISTYILRGEFNSLQSSKACNIAFSVVTKRNSLNRAAQGPHVLGPKYFYRTAVLLCYLGSPMDISSFHVCIKWLDVTFTANPREYRIE